MPSDMKDSHTSVSPGQAFDKELHMSDRVPEQVYSKKQTDIQDISNIHKTFEYASLFDMNGARFHHHSPFQDMVNQEIPVTYLDILIRHMRKNIHMVHASIQEVNGQPNMNDRNE